MWVGLTGKLKSQGVGLRSETKICEEVEGLEEEKCGKMIEVQSNTLLVITKKCISYSILFSFIMICFLFFFRCMYKGTPILHCY